MNPSIDSHGLTREDFDEDPEFHEDYMSGAYNIPCELCKGRSVMPEFEDSDVGDELKKARDKFMYEVQSWGVEEEMERMMGA